MNEEEYIKKVKRKLWIIKSDRREEIVREIKSDIEERKTAGEKIEEILKDMPAPAELRKEYIKIYGISHSAILLVAIFACIISVFTLSILPFSSIPFYPAPVFLIVLALFIAYTTDQFGIKIGFTASISSGTFRIVLFYLTILLLNPPLQNGTQLMEVITSIVIALIPVLIKRKEK